MGEDFLVQQVVRFMYDPSISKHVRSGLQNRPLNFFSSSKSSVRFITRFTFQAL